jgi:uncharacterized protein DUF5666
MSPGQAPSSSCTRRGAGVRRLAALLGVAIVASCGGGVDSGGTGAPATSFASGAITGFGSVIVERVHFDDSAATVSDGDGNLRSRSDLRLGMTAAVLGSAIMVDASGNDVSSASSIVFASEIVGPLAANDVAGRTLSLLGQTVDIAPTTVFDDNLGGGQAALQLGDVVEVYAHLDPATGRYEATRVERKGSVAAYALRGIVAGLDPLARTFAIGATRISYAGTPTASLSAALADGAFVRVTLALAPVGGIWNALRVADGARALANRDDARIKGLVSSFVSSTSFGVDGTPVDARTAQFPNGSAGLALGTRVEVEGATVSGVLVARTVTLVSDSDEDGTSFEARGAITALDSVAQTFVVHDVVVSYAGSVDFRDGSATDLAIGREVRARGMLSGDGTRLRAERIDFEH